MADFGSELNPEMEMKIVNEMIGTEFAVPDFQTKGAGAIDLRACIDESSITLGPGECRVIGSGVAFHIANPNIIGEINPRSGSGAKRGICVGNLAGQIDSDYTGEIMVAVWNRNFNEDVVIERGERVAQMKFIYIARPSFKVVEAFSENSERGDKGFGSTGSQ